MYSYNTPEDAIRSLEKAYTNKDIRGIVDSKDFETEALLLLQQSSYDYDEYDEALIAETAKLLELSLINVIHDNGYPNFEGLECEFFDLSLYNGNIYTIQERINYLDGFSALNRIFVVKHGDLWKVATIEE